MIPTIHFVDTDPDVVEALRSAFEEFERVSIRHGNILDIAEDTIVSPANSYGYMDGGVDKIYREFFGEKLDEAVLEAIRFRATRLAVQNGENPQYAEAILPVGESTLAKTNHPRIRYILLAPTMFLPQGIPAENCRQAMLAVLNCGKRSFPHIKNIYCPGLGTGVGGLAPALAAKTMAKAYRDWMAHHDFPSPAGL